MSSLCRRAVKSAQNLSFCHVFQKWHTPSKEGRTSKPFCKNNQIYFSVGRCFKSSAMLQILWSKHIKPSFLSPSTRNSDKNHKTGLMCLDHKTRTLGLATLKSRPRLFLLFPKQAAIASACLHSVDALLVWSLPLKCTCVTQPRCEIVHAFASHSVWPGPKGRITSSSARPAYSHSKDRTNVSNVCWAVLAI